MSPLTQKSTPVHSTETLDLLSSRPEKVLLVDDEHAVRSITARMIEALGFEVEEATGGADGLQRFVCQPGAFSAVLADLTMPDVDGFKLMNELRRVRPDVRYVLMSGLTDGPGSTDPAHHPPAAFLQKPFTMTRLREVLEPTETV